MVIFQNNTKIIKVLCSLCNTFFIGYMIELKCKSCGSVSAVSIGLKKEVGK